MRKILPLFLFALLLAQANADQLTNVIYGNVGDYRLNPAKKVTVSLVLTYPNPRLVGNTAVRSDDISTLSDTNGYFAFTNLQWGYYTMTISGKAGTDFPYFVHPDSQGNIAFGSLIPPHSPQPPNPASNYYTKADIDALVAGIPFVTQIIAGANVTVSPPNGLGAVTVNSTGGSGGSGDMAGPGSSVISNLVIWNNTLGTLTKDSGFALASVASTVYVAGVSNLWFNGSNTLATATAAVQTFATGVSNKWNTGSNDLATATTAVQTFSTGVSNKWNSGSNNLATFSLAVSNLWDTGSNTLAGLLSGAGSGNVVGSGSSTAGKFVLAANGTMTLVTNASVGPSDFVLATNLLQAVATTNLTVYGTFSVSNGVFTIMQVTNLYFVGTGTSNGVSSFFTNYFDGDFPLGTLGVYNWDGVGGNYSLSFTVDSAAMTVHRDFTLSGSHTLTVGGFISAPGGYIGQASGGAEAFDMNADGSLRILGGGINFIVDGSTASDGWSIYTNAIDLGDGPEPALTFTNPLSGSGTIVNIGGDFQADTVASLTGFSGKGLGITNIINGSTLTSTNITLSFNGSEQMFTITNGPDIFFTAPLANFGHTGFLFKPTGRDHVTLHWVYDIDFYASATNNLATNGATLWVDCWNNTNRGYLKASILNP